MVSALVRRAIVFAAVGSIVAASCTGGGGTEPTERPSKRGGSVVLGAEQWPDCLNPITFCSAGLWGWYTVLEHVLPRAMEMDLRGNYVASPLLLETPSLENSLIRTSPFSVTYRVDPEARVGRRLAHHVGRFRVHVASHHEHH